jgi:hypothetical protein
MLLNRNGDATARWGSLCVGVGWIGLLVGIIVAIVGIIHIILGFFFVQHINTANADLPWPNQQYVYQALMQRPPQSTQ